MWVSVSRTNPGSILPDPGLVPGTAPPLARCVGMPRYYFHLYNDVISMDDEGKMLPDLDAARANAIKEAREMMMETVAEGRINFSHRVEIADHKGDIAATVLFGEAVTVEG